MPEEAEVVDYIPEAEVCNICWDCDLFLKSCGGMSRDDFDCTDDPNTELPECFESID